MLLVLALVLAYLVGAIPTAVWLGKATHGVDVREHGSGNMGATNVMRVLGWKVGLFVLLFDIIKGYVAARIVSLIELAPYYDALLMGTPPLEMTIDVFEWTVAVQLMCGVGAILGHSFPVFAGFRGGKGVATSAGVLLAVTPGALGVAALAFALGFGLTRYVAVGSLAAAVAYPATLYFLRFGLERPVPTVLLVIGTFMGAWLFWTHRTNIARLRAGTEKKIRFGRGRAEADPF
jgi:acyl phosphate:glycerol-3-phosphate acyltransferase